MQSHPYPISYTVNWPITILQHSHRDHFDLQIQGVPIPTHKRPWQKKMLQML